jgi:tripartite-type tricarboxylate transporter receptor subunit TctC
MLFAPAISAAIVAISLFFPCSPAAAQTYPAKPVRVIVPFAAGGGLDIVLRPLLQKMSESLHQQFVIDIRAGANGIIGTEIGAKSPADGYTLIGATTGSITINPSVYPKLPFDVARDLVAVSNVGATSFVMVVHPSLNVHNVREFIVLAKRHPGELTYGSPGIGGTNHLAAEYFLQQTGTRLIHVPYKGSQPLIADLIGGHVIMGFDSMMATMPQVRAGRLRAMGVAAAKRSPVAPEVPTLAEAGGPGLVIGSWYGLFAPAGTPREILNKLHAEITKALAIPELRERYQSTGLEPIGSNSEQFAAEVRDDTARWAKVARTANVHAE